MSNLSTVLKARRKDLGLFVIKQNPAPGRVRGL